MDYLAASSNLVDCVGNEWLIIVGGYTVYMYQCKEVAEHLLSSVSADILRRDVSSSPPDECLLQVPILVEQ